MLMKFRKRRWLGHTARTSQISRRSKRRHGRRWDDEDTKNYEIKHILGSSYSQKNK